MVCLLAWYSVCGHVCVLKKTIKAQKIKEEFPDYAADTEVGRSFLIVTPVCVHCWAVVDGI